LSIVQINSLLMTIDLGILYVFNVSRLIVYSIAICATVLNIIKIIIKIRTEKKLLLMYD